jgi:hypothetical protein
VEAVISSIGPEKNLPPGTLMSVGVANILAECKRANVRRFIMQSGIGLSEGHELSWLNRFVVSVSGRIFTDDCADCQLRAATNESNWIRKIVNVGS